MIPALSPTAQPCHRSQQSALFFSAPDSPLQVHELQWVGFSVVICLFLFFVVYGVGETVGALSFLSSVI